MLVELQKILMKGDITSLYQPIVDKHTGEIFAYEALSRGPSDSPLHSPLQLFEQARKFNLLGEIESLCREKAAIGFVEQNLPGKLFINITPQSLEQAGHQKGQTLALLDNLDLESSQIVIELTEQFPSSDEAVLLNAIKHYQEMGLSIALDDLGAGYSSLRLWSQSRPEFVKIDRHFIQDIDQDHTKQEFVRSFVEIATSMQCKVIAEGVETLAEHSYLSKLKIDFFQGYLFCRPQAKPPVKLTTFPVESKAQASGARQVSANSLSVHKLSVNSDASVEQAAAIFQDKPNINSIAVVDNEQILGLISRAAVQGKLSQPFGRDLFSKKRAVEVVMHTQPLVVDASLSIEQVSRLVTSRARYRQEDDFVICKESKYLGVGHVIDLLKQVTQLQLNQARHANPLTLLPGLVPINDCVDQLIASNNAFAMVHFDIDNFKPFNDVYGFAKGDQVILALGMSLQKHYSIERDTVGHIGGDDFIAIYNSQDWLQRVKDTVTSFNAMAKELYYPAHIVQGGFSSEDRYGVSRFHPLVSLSVAVLEVKSEDSMDNFALSSKLSPLKHAAKSHVGNAIIINQADNYLLIEAVRDMTEGILHQK